MELLEPLETAECPICLAPMNSEEQDGELWLVCPNGCPTEVEVRKPVEAESISVDLARKATGGAA